MRYPEFLKEGGTIGLIAPSFGCTIQPYKALFDEARIQLKNKGYSFAEGPNCSLELGIGKSNTPRACAAEINDFFCNDRSDIIISCGGGETMCEDLSHVDFEAIAKASPKWFMGYSDNTNLVFTLPTLCDTAAIYGPHICEFGQRPWHEAVADALDLLTGRNLKLHNYKLWEKTQLKNPDNPYASYNTTEPFSMKLGGSASGGAAEFSGRLLGGCLDCLSILCGTKFDRVKEFNRRYEKDGVIWFFESCELGPMSVLRSLWQLKNAGWFESAKGFLVGRPMMYDEEAFGLDQCGAVTCALEDLGLPIVMNADFGHLPPMMPIIAGAMADVTAAEGSLVINQRLE